MSFTVTTRLSRGVFLSSRVSPLVGLLLSPLFLLAILVDLLELLCDVLHLMAGASAAVGKVAEASAKFPTTTRRAALARHIVRDVIEVDAATAGQANVKVWAVYALDTTFFHGRYPNELQRYEALYPSRKGQAATVGLYPSAAIARRVARDFAKNRYSLDELIGIFGTRP